MMGIYAGAQGFGAVTVGGEVPVHVTRLDDPVFTQAQFNAKTHLTPGNLRCAMAQPGSRKIIFDTPVLVRLWCPIEEYNHVPLTFNETL